MTNDVMVVVLVLAGFEIEAAALCDGAEVVFKFFSGHANTGVFDGQCACFLVRCQANVKIVFVECAVFVCQGFVIDLVDGVRRIGNQFA